MNVYDEERWTPVRFVRDEQVCAFCGARIPQARPGTTTGTRGTKAFFSHDSKRWSCSDCYAIVSRSDRARAECGGCRSLVGRFEKSPGVWIHRTREGVESPCSFVE